MDADDTDWPTPADNDRPGEFSDSGSLNTGLIMRGVQDFDAIKLTASGRGKGERTAPPAVSDKQVRF